MPKKEQEPKMTFQIIYDDGKIEGIRGNAVEIKQRFYSYVKSILTLYISGVKEVQLLDQNNRVFKSYKQHF